MLYIRACIPIIYKKNVPRIEINLIFHAMEMLHMHCLIPGIIVVFATN